MSDKIEPKPKSSSDKFLSFDGKGNAYFYDVYGFVYKVDSSALDEETKKKDL